jgi:hypothetical protein
MALSIPFTPFGEPAPRPHGHPLHEYAHVPSDSMGSLALGTPEQAGFHSLIQPIVLLAAIFIASTVVVVTAVSTVPTLAIPHDLAGVLEQGVALKRYSSGSANASFHILGVLTLLFVYKQAFSSECPPNRVGPELTIGPVPGSLLTNILFGSLYGVFWSTILTSILTAVGSLACYFMAYKTSPLVRYALPKPLAFLEKNIESRTKNPADLFSYLLLMRLFPLLPYAALNIAGGVLAVPASPFFWTLVLGSIPYNMVTTQM